MARQNKIILGSVNIWAVVAVIGLPNSNLPRKQRKTASVRQRLTHEMMEFRFCPPGVQAGVSFLFTP